jgi:dihydropyrimidine dehydrogenase (NAD+) subunit PreA
VIDAECVGCNLRVVVCLVENRVTLVPLTAGVDPRAGAAVGGNRTLMEHPNNPAAEG